MNPISAWFAQYKLYAILAVGAAVIAGSFYAAWSWRGALAAEDQNKAVASAVTSAVEGIKERLEEEKIARAFFQQLANDRINELMTSLKEVRDTQMAVAVAVQKGRSRDPKFYNQPIPLPEREAWLKARKLAEQPAPSASSPP